MAEDQHGAQDLDARRARGHHDHRMAAVLGRIVTRRAHHHDIDAAARVARAAGPVFLAVQDVIVAVPHAGHGNVRGIRRGDIGFGHQIGGPDLAFQQRLEPVLLHLRRPVLVEHLHVPGIGGGTVEDLGRQRRLAHLFGEIGVFDGRQPMAAVAIGQPEVPQPRRLGPGLQPFQDLGLPVGIGPAVALADLLVVFLLQRHDLVAHHRRHAVQQLALVGPHSEVHVHPISSPA